MYSSVIFDNSCIIFDNSYTYSAVKVASCVIKGSYAQMGEATAAVASWINENGYQVNGPMFNIYHVSPNETQNPDEYVTELCFPIE